MADTLDVITLDEGKTYINKDNDSDAGFQAELAVWITAASRRLDELVGPVVQRTFTEEKHDGGRQVVFLDKHPLTSITSVTEYDGTVSTALTVETNASKPVDAYLVDAYSADPAYLSNIVRRRSSGADARFPSGRQNVVVSYVAGRFTDTASVDKRFKVAAGIMLQNFYRSQQHGVLQVDEYDVPHLSFPTFAVPRAVVELFPGEIQSPLPI